MTKKKVNKAAQFFEEAIKLRDKGDYTLAINKFNDILEENRKSNAMVLGLIGHSYFSLKDFVKALDYYQQSVLLSPKSSLASLGLFHTLVNMDRVDEGFAELRRFLSISESEEHFRLIEEMRDSLLDSETDY